MDLRYENAIIIQKANVYFEGKVNSRTVIKNSGERITLGFMVAGEYTFGTDSKELMEVINGKMEVLLPGKNEWECVTEGKSFSVPGRSSFQVRVADFADYCCSYLDE